MAADVTGPASLTAKRLALRKLVKDHKLLWEELEKNFGYRLNSTPKKDKTSPSKFVLEAVRGKGKKGKKQRFTSCKFKQKFASKAEAKKIENTMLFGDTLLTQLLTSRKRHRGNLEGEVSHRWSDSPVAQKKSRHEHLAQRLQIRASRNGVESQMYAATKGYTCFKCIGDMRNKSAISNFIAKLKRRKKAEQHREIADKSYRELAQHLRRGLEAGTIKNFVRPREDDENDDRASWRREKSALPLRNDYSAYDLFRVQKQMLGLAVYYEAMLVTGGKETDRFATQEDALIYAGDCVNVSSRTVRAWRNDFQKNNRQFTERCVNV